MPKKKSTKRKQPKPPPVVVKLLTGDKMPRETKKAVLGCNDYLRLGGGRSLKKLKEFYTGDNLEINQNPPTKNIQTLKDWSRKFGWVDRANEYDIQQEGVKNSLIKERMHEGLSLDYHRIEKLKVLYQFLESELFDELPDGKLTEKNLWVVVNKIAGNDLKYNSALIQDLLKIMDDLAKETGGRIQKQDITKREKKIVVTIKGGELYED